VKPAAICREPLTTQEVRYHPAKAGRVNNMAGFSLFVDVTGSEFAKIAQERRNVRLLSLLGTVCLFAYGYQH